MRGDVHKQMLISLYLLQSTMSIYTEFLTNGSSPNLTSTVLPPCKASNPTFTQIADFISALAAAEQEILLS